MRGGVFHELLRCIVELPSLVVKRRDVCVARHVVDVVGYGAGSIILTKTPLSGDHPRQLVEQALEGCTFPIDELRTFEVLLDHRRAHYQSMLIHHRLHDLNDPRLLGDGAPVGVLTATIVGVLLNGTNQELGEHPTAAIALAQNQLDVLLFGNSLERIERLVVVAAQIAPGGNEKYATMEKIKDCIGRLVLA